MTSENKNDINHNLIQTSGEAASAAIPQKKTLREKLGIRRSVLDKLLDGSYRSWLPGKQDDDDDDDDGGDGLPDLHPDDTLEYEQRVIRRKGESKFAAHVREARDMSDTPDPDMEAGASIQGHPLLRDIPLGSQAPIEQIDAAKNDAAKIELKMKLENKKRAEHTSTPTPRAY